MSDQPTDPYNVLPDLNRSYQAAQQWDTAKDRDAAAKAIAILDKVANLLLLERARLGEEIWRAERDQVYAADRNRR